MVRGKHDFIEFIHNPLHRYDRKTVTVFGYGLEGIFLDLKIQL